MPDKADARTEAPHLTTSRALLDRVARLRRSATQRSSVARGMLLFSGLAVFTLLYALLLHWISEPYDSLAVRPSRQPLATPWKSGQPLAARVKREPVSAVKAGMTFTHIDDADRGSSQGFVYSGAWQHIGNKYDGRSAGTSTRTFHIGASASFRFTGRRLRVYGVKGPNGGYAELRIDGETFALLRFYAPHKQAGVLIYASPELSAGAHPVAIIVAEAPDGLPKRRYVNLDGVAYAP